MAIYETRARTVRIGLRRGRNTFQNLKYWQRDVESVVMRGREATRRTSEGHCASLKLSESPLAVSVPLAYDPLNIGRVHQHDVDSFATPPHLLRMAVS